MATPSRTKKWLKRIFVYVPIWFFLITVMQVLLMKWLNPLATSFMVSRQMSALSQADFSFQLDYRWRSYSQISPHLKIAVVAAEDQRFPTHNGFDMVAIRKAYRSNLRGKKVRGASTMTQQLAKNLFLWSGRSYVRKALEAWYTLLIEVLWSKQRILEVYVNVVEFGDGVYGAEAAAQRFFHRSAKNLSMQQAAQLAAVLPNPKVYNAKNPGPYVQRRAKAVLRQMRQLGGDAYLNTCCKN